MIKRLVYPAVSSMLFVALICTLICALERPAYAYVDPGSGLLIFQSLSAVVTGALFYFRRRLKALFSRNSPAQSKTTQDPS